jgi:glycosyltransferase involved in cell wall biosynthesis
MYHADLIGGLAGKLAGRIPTAWNIRHTDLAFDRNRRTTVWTAMACARTSAWLPRCIVCCSETSRKTHVALGYARDRMVVIPNGLDTASFKPDPAARESVRKEFGLLPGAVLIGLVARFDPQKDHRNFILAAARLHAMEPDVHFLLCGSGVADDNSQLTAWIQEAGVSSRCHLLGLRDDVPRLAAALDIAASASVGEGFPNVIAEAMACGVPPVVTDVGDAAWLVANTGRVVPARDPEALANAWLNLLRMGHDRRQQLGLAARRRIETSFELSMVTERYQALYTELATGQDGR